MIIYLHCWFLLWYLNSAFRSSFVSGLGSVSLSTVSVSSPRQRRAVASWPSGDSLSSLMHAADSEPAVFAACWAIMPAQSVVEMTAQAAAQISSARMPPQEDSPMLQAGTVFFEGRRVQMERNPFFPVFVWSRGRGQLMPMGVRIAWQPTGASRRAGMMVIGIWLCHPIPLLQNTRIMLHGPTSSVTGRVMPQWQDGTGQQNYVILALNCTGRHFVGR
jgi:hypothetical protein